MLKDTLGLPREKQEGQKKTLGVLVGTRLNMNQENVLVRKKVNGVQGCTERSVSRRPRKVIPPFSSVLVTPPLKCWVQFWAPHWERDMAGTGESPIKVMKMIDRNISPMRKG